MPDTVFCATSPFFGTHDHFTTVILERQMPVEGDPQVFQGVTSLSVSSHLPPGISALILLSGSTRMLWL